ncbi:bleomycin resistance protein [Clostridium estertheticum]|uniref:bleomycin resistance protein n=1 Tax=Clostridium estertheticum TaxID=238834 RepID=UPI001C7CE6C0|nr:VOC family protein [Clostridium estertheticum]MBX4272188.1 VOC family protein [Clostridium estertheticum]WLC78394.1 VOC family protein [Clostridium estertheticum]
MKFNALIPELSVSNVNKSKKFYIDILGFHLEYERVEDKFAFLSYGEAQIMLEEINGHWNTSELQYPFGRGINFQIATDDVYKLSYNLKQNNITLFRDIVENQYKCNGEVIVEKEILFKDPDGYLLRFSQTESE